MSAISSFCACSAKNGSERRSDKLSFKRSFISAAASFVNVTTSSLSTLVRFASSSLKILSTRTVVLPVPAEAETATFFSWEISSAIS